MPVNLAEVHSEELGSHVEIGVTTQFLYLLDPGISGLLLMS